ncbi:MAG: KOW motif-containing protein, partial [Pseudobutyrivibrio sp.]|nr:KOW motif-containing protein [Pseudobutyrivibrio sp.]
IENEKMFRIKGEWIVDRKPLFPGYLFVETDNPEDFNYRLRKKYHSLKLLQVDGKITPIKLDEEEYLKAIGGKEHIVKYSEGFRIGNRIEITSGSFAGYKGRIIKLDRHNRRARLQLPLMGQNVEVEIGLGIVKSL